MWDTWKCHEILTILQVSIKILNFNEKSYNMLKILTVVMKILQVSMKIQVMCQLVAVSLKIRVILEIEDYRGYLLKLYKFQARIEICQSRLLLVAVE